MFSEALTMSPLYHDYKAQRRPADNLLPMQLRQINLRVPASNPE